MENKLLEKSPAQIIQEKHREYINASTEFHYKLIQKNITDLGQEILSQIEDAISSIDFLNDLTPEQKAEFLVKLKEEKKYWSKAILH